MVKLLFTQRQIWFYFLVISLIGRVFICVSEAEGDSESTVHYVIGAILYRTLGLILPAPKWVHAA